MDLHTRHAAWAEGSEARGGTQNCERGTQIKKAGPVFKVYRKNQKIKQISGAFGPHYQNSICFRHWWGGGGGEERPNLFFVQ